MASAHRSKFGIMILLAVFVLGLSACGSYRLNKENFDKIQTGMTQAQVQAILGTPTESSSVDIGGFSGTNSTWRWDGNSISVQFLNGQVVAKQLAMGVK
jgi:hypothetical protein